jgi:hypothetical protein
MARDYSIYVPEEVCVKYQLANVCEVFCFNYCHTVNLFKPYPAIVTTISFIGSFLHIPSYTINQNCRELLTITIFWQGHVNRWPKALVWWKMTKNNLSVSQPINSPRRAGTRKKKSRKSQREGSNEQYYHSPMVSPWWGLIEPWAPDCWAITYQYGMQTDWSFLVWCLVRWRNTDFIDDFSPDIGHLSDWPLCDCN